MTAVRTRGQVTTSVEERATVLDALPAILDGLQTVIRPNTTICPEDGCLIAVTGPCPACEVRSGPRRCSCGRRLKCPEADLCWVCLRVARMAARRVCECGTQIRTDADRCYRCLHAPVAAARVDVDRPFRWVRRGGILRPVFEQSAVA